jgi:hypothetical protein
MDAFTRRSPRPEPPTGVDTFACAAGITARNIIIVVVVVVVIDAVYVSRDE